MVRLRWMFLTEEELVVFYLGLVRFQVRCNDSTENDAEKKSSDVSKIVDEGEEAASQ